MSETKRALPGLRMRGLVLIAVGVAVLVGTSKLVTTSMAPLGYGAGTFLALFGVQHLLAGDRMLRRARGELIEENAESVARGLQAGAGSPANAKQRLAQLESLRRDGLVTDAEYQAKRRDIVADL